MKNYHIHRLVFVQEEAIWAYFGLHFNAPTGPRCPSKLFTTAPDWIFRHWTAPASVPIRTNWSSGVKQETVALLFGDAKIRWTVPSYPSKTIASPGSAWTSIWFPLQLKSIDLNLIGSVGVGIRWVAIELFKSLEFTCISEKAPPE